MFEATKRFLQKNTVLPRSIWELIYKWVDNSYIIFQDFFGGHSQPSGFPIVCYCDRAWNLPCIHLINQRYGNEHVIDSKIMENREVMFEYVIPYSPTFARYTFQHDRVIGFFFKIIPDVVFLTEYTTWFFGIVIGQRYRALYKCNIWIKDLYRFLLGSRLNRYYVPIPLEDAFRKQFQQAFVHFAFSNKNIRKNFTHVRRRYGSYFPSAKDE